MQNVCIILYLQISINISCPHVCNKFNRIPQLPSLYTLMQSSLLLLTLRLQFNIITHKSLYETIAWLQSSHSAIANQITWQNHVFGDSPHTFLHLGKPVCRDYNVNSIKYVAISRIHNRMRRIQKHASRGIVVI